jgi:hypothetical protein
MVIIGHICYQLFTLSLKLLLLSYEVNLLLAYIFGTKFHGRTCDGHIKDGL